MFAAALLSLQLVLSGNLHFGATQDALTDQPRFTAGFSDHGGGFTVGCAPERTHRLLVLVIFDNFIGVTHAGPFTGGTRIDYRFDSAPPLSTRGDAKRTDVIFEAADTPRFVAALRASTKLYVRVIDHRGLPRDATFTYADGEGAVTEMLDRCGLDGSGRAKDR